MKIAMIIHNQVSTGPYFKVLEQCVALAQAGHQVTLFATSATRRLLPNKVMHKGVEIIESPDLLWGKLRQGIDLYNTLWRCIIAGKKQFDIVHAIDARPNVILTALHIKYWQKIPLVLSWWDLFGDSGIATERFGALYGKTLGKVEVWFEEFFRKYADGATAITSYLAERLRGMNFPTERTAVIHVGCDASLAVPNRVQARASIAPLGIQPDDTVLCFIGTIYQSDLNFLFRALDIVRSKTEQSFKILWIGNHRLEPLLLSAYNIIHAGHLPTMDDVYRYLAACDIALLPFVVNTANKARWHSKITDYFNMALPVVTTPVSDFPKIFAEHDCGWMAQSGSPDHFAECLLTALHNPATWRSKGDTAKEYAQTHLDTALLARDLTNLYTQTVSNTVR
jgi:glycosyltransferase involved in cell wall biosynthesis